MKVIIGSHVANRSSTGGEGDGARERLEGRASVEGTRGHTKVDVLHEGRNTGGREGWWWFTC